MKPKYDPHKHHRRSIRLKGYDYSQAGAYFVTICTHHKVCFFGYIEKGEMVLNDAGNMVNAQWLALAGRFPNIQFGEYIAMPNHFHAILIIRNNIGQVQDNIGQVQDLPLRAGEQNEVGTSAKLGDMIGAFKSITTSKYIKGVNNCAWLPFDQKLWQRNYYEHIIRNEKNLID